MHRISVPRFLGLLLLTLAPLRSAEQDALSIDANIRARHMPYGTILNPILSADRTSVVSYTRCGDSAIWTGHYLAAEAFRYQATHSADALANARAALDGLIMLTDVTGVDVPARCALPADSPYAASIASEESANGVHQTVRDGQPWLWIGNTSRDQYSGVFFGLGAAFDMVPDAAMRADIASLATRLLDRLLDKAWNVVLPDGTISTTFLLRPDQQLTLLQVGRHVNPQRFSSLYSKAASSLAFSVPVPLGVDAADDHDSYFKFNLDFINLYNLIRLQGGGLTKFWYEIGFGAVRSATDNHRNAHFNMIDRALHGPSAGRDAETREVLDQWLERPRTDVWVDVSGRYPECGDPPRACHPIAIVDRPPSDFLWQLDPFQLSGGGMGIIETAGIDYILPYWMARYYGVE